MTCIKCGFEMDKPMRECPRCGDLQPRIEIVRDSMEAGSLDAWAEEIVPGDVSDDKFSISNYIKDHPSSPLFIGALGCRLVFYIIALLLLLVNFSMWKGWGLVLNFLVAGIATFLIIAQPDEQDCYWLKTISTIGILTDTAATVLLVAWPVIAKVVNFIFNLL